MTLSRGVVIPLAALCLMAGCASGPDSQQPSEEAPPTFPDSKNIGPPDEHPDDLIDRAFKPIDDGVEDLNRDINRPKDPK